MTKLGPNTSSSDSITVVEIKRKSNIFLSVLIKSGRRAASRCQARHYVFGGCIFSENLKKKKEYIPLMIADVGFLESRMVDRRFPWLVFAERII